MQAQRDFFGAHGFERIDGPGAFHGPWGAERAASAAKSDAMTRLAICWKRTWW
nr:hypothetical protein [Mesorhizobium sp.]